MEVGRWRLVRLSKKEATIICIEYKRDSCGWREEEKTRFYKIGVLPVIRDEHMAVRSEIKKAGWNRFQFKLK